MHPDLNNEDVVSALEDRIAQIEKDLQKNIPERQKLWLEYQRNMWEKRVEILKKR